MNNHLGKSFAEKIKSFFGYFFLVSLNFGQKAANKIE